MDQVRRHVGTHHRRIVLRTDDGAERPYPGIQPPYKGNVTETQDELNAWVERVHRAGIQVNCHANGDVAIDMFLTAVERAQKLFPRTDARPKITHCTLINDDLVRRIKAVGAVPAMFTTYAFYNSDKFLFYGEELMKRCMAYRYAPRCGSAGGGRLRLQPGTVRAVDGHSGHGDAQGLGRQDVGREPANHRRGGDPGQHDERGLRVAAKKRSRDPSPPGKLADFVVLADDPHTVDPEKIKDIQIVRTVVGGATKYQA